MPWKQLLQILEGNAVWVSVKGDHEVFRPRVVYFTSDCPPWAWTFAFDKAQARQGLNESRLRQLMRRFSSVEEVADGIDYRQALGMAVPAPPLEGPVGGANTRSAPPSSSAWENVHLPQLPFDVIPDCPHDNAF